MYNLNTFKHKPPPMWYVLAEITIFVELLTFTLFYRWFLKRHMNIGNNRPIIVLPGFLTGDWSTSTLRRFLKDCGFSVYGWNCGINLQYTTEIYTQLNHHVLDIYAKNEQKIILIGHSAGGLYARELSKDYPDIIDTVITVGTPFTCKFKGVSNWLHLIHKWIFKKEIVDNIDCDILARLDTPVPDRVRTISIGSYTDGVISLNSTVDKKCSESISTIGSHTGMNFNWFILDYICHHLK